MTNMNSWNRYLSEVFLIYGITAKDLKTVEKQTDAIFLNLQEIIFAASAANNAWTYEKACAWNSEVKRLKDLKDLKVTSNNHL